DEEVGEVGDHRAEVGPGVGVPRRELWRDDDARASLGAVIPGFANFFVLYGPNARPGHGASGIVAARAALGDVRQLLRRAGGDRPIGAPRPRGPARAGLRRDDLPSRDPRAARAPRRPPHPW